MNPKPQNANFNDSEKKIDLKTIWEKEKQNSPVRKNLRFCSKRLHLTTQNFNNTKLRLLLHKKPMSLA